MDAHILFVYLPGTFTLPVLTYTILASNSIFLDILLLKMKVLLISLFFIMGIVAKSDPKFRMEKINFIWSKAQNSLDEKMSQKLQV